MKLTGSIQEFCECEHHHSSFEVFRSLWTKNPYGIAVKPQYNLVCIETVSATSWTNFKTWLEVQYWPVKARTSYGHYLLLQSPDRFKISSAKQVLKWTCVLGRFPSPELASDSVSVAEKQWPKLSTLGKNRELSWVTAFAEKQLLNKRWEVLTRWARENFATTSMSQRHCLCLDLW